MKRCSSLVLILLVFTKHCSADIMSRFLDKAPEMKSQINELATKTDQSRSNLDLDSYFKFSSQFDANSSSKPIKSTQENTPTQKTVPIVQLPLDLTTLARSRRLNQQPCNEPPSLTSLSQMAGINILQPVPSTFATIDNSLFSTEAPIIQEDLVEAQLRQKIGILAQSLGRVKSSQLKYENSIDIEQKNTELFTEAKIKIDEEIKMYRSQLTNMKLKANQILEQKNIALVVLENLVNKRQEKIKQTLELDKKNEALNVQYSLIEKQIEQITNGDKLTESQIQSLIQKEYSVKQEFENLKKKYDDFNSEKANIVTQSQNTSKEKQTIQTQLEDLKTQLSLEGPLNNDLIQRSELIQTNLKDIEIEIRKYIQESSLLNNQLQKLGQLKKQAVDNLALFDQKKQALVDLNDKIRVSGQQALTKQTALLEFENDLKRKEKACKCSKSQLSKIMNEKQMAQNNQQTIQNLMTNIQTNNPMPNNMKLFNNIMLKDSQPVVQNQPKLPFLNDPYFTQTHFFKND